MAYADFADWQDALLNPGQILSILQIPTQSNTGRLSSMWAVSPLPGVAPTTAAVPARNIAGALGQENGGATALRIPAIEIGTGAGAGTYVLCDRLSHQGGLSGTVTGAQTTNLPTAALTRYTSGEGVMCGLEIYTIVGTTATTAAVSYTDQAGNTGNTSPLVVFGGSGHREATRFVMIPNADGDTGFRAVASVTLAATTGTAGAFGVTLYKPLLYLPVGYGENFIADPVLGTMGGGLPEILDDACLFWLYTTTNLSATALTHRFSED